MEESINFNVEIKKAKYKHFKGGLYETIDVAYHSEDNMPYVLYKSLEDGRLWTRPINEFYENIIRDKYNGPRFKEIEE